MTCLGPILLLGIIILTALVLIIVEMYRMHTCDHEYELKDGYHRCKKCGKVRYEEDW